MLHIRQHRRLNLVFCYVKATLLLSQVGFLSMLKEVKIMLNLFK